ncbi:Transcriptional repressor CTCF-like [Mycena venus]|uniref:Transcriptional repressor CTCF-like n=1 Tax=Mycena venus TaxID=2733690 RepID=A0A8H6U4B6_9AGAR|nr:Transcriptional repressor CTCF-like [Mycena venus]
MARSSSTSSQPSKPESTTCGQCGITVRRPADLPRHMLIHAPNKEEFMYTCPVEGCSHQTLQRSNLTTHIRRHTRTRPYECPDYHTSGQKKNKHGLKPRSMTAEASGSGTREESVESTASFDAASADADPPGAGPVVQPTATGSTVYSFIHVPYFAFAGGKVSGHQ